MSSIPSRDAYIDLGRLPAGEGEVSFGLGGWLFYVASGSPDMSEVRLADVVVVNGRIIKDRTGEVVMFDEEEES